MVDMYSMLYPDWETDLFTFDVRIYGINDKILTGFVDTGSDDSIITEEAYKKIRKLTFKYTAEVNTFDRSEEDKLSLPFTTIELEFFGLKRVGPLILARGYFKNLEKVEVLVGRRHLKNVVITIDSEGSINIVKKIPKRRHGKNR